MAVKYRFLLLLWIGFGTLYAQTHVRFHYTQRNGLPQISVIDMFRDSSQYLWITTEDGLVRYDGHSFQISNISNNPIIKNDRFRWILPNENGKILTSTIDGCIFEIKNNKLYPYLSQNLKHQRIQGILPDKENLVKLLKLKPSFYGLQNDIKHFPIQLVNINRKTYILGHKAIYQLSGDRKSNPIPLPKDHIRSIFNIQNQAFACGQNQLYWINPSLNTFIPVKLEASNLIDNTTRFFYQPISKNICFITQGKIYLLKIDNEQPTKLSTSFIIDINNQIENPISNISIDETMNVIAIGTLTNGLYVFKPKLFITQPYVNSSEPNNGSYAFVGINDSTILTANGLKLTPHTIEKSSFQLHHVNNMFLHYDRNNRLWNSRADSLFYQVEGSERIFSLRDSGSNLNNFGSYGDSLLVVTKNHLIVLYKGTVIYKAPFEYDHQRYQISYGTSVCRHQNKWYISIENLGLCSLNLGSTATLTLLNDYKQIRFLTSINNILIGGTYGNGWFAFSNQKLWKLPLDPLHYLSKVHTVMLDSMGRLYLTTNKGLFTTHLSQLNNFINGKQSSVYYQYFDDNDGIENIEFNGGCNPSGIALKNGYFVCPNIQGAIWFNPYLLDKQNSKAPKLINLDYAETDGEFIPNVNDSFELSSSTEKFTLGFSIIYWNNPNNVRLEYKLTNFHSRWMSLNIESPVVSLTNLPHGTYDLIVRAQFGFNPNDVEFYTIHIVKNPKYHETWVFVLLLAFLIFIVIIGINFLYNRQLRNQNILLEEKVSERTSELEKTNQRLLQSESELMQSVNVKNKLISIISHDIVTPLKFISLASKNYQSGEIKSTDTEFIREIQHTSQRLFDNAQNILNWVRYQNNLIRVNKTNLAPFAIADEIADLFKELALMRKNTIVNDVDMDDVIVSDKTILIIILQNLISNAVKYTQGSTIVISSKREGEHYKITVSDNGNGISSSNLRRIESIRNRTQTSIFEDSADGTGLGYIIIFELAELIGAYVHIDTEERKGTCITISLS